MRPKCKICKREIKGTIKIKTYQKRVGNKLVNTIDYYDEECFKALNKERAANKNAKKERNN